MANAYIRAEIGSDLTASNGRRIIDVGIDDCSVSDHGASDHTAAASRDDSTCFVRERNRSVYGGIRYGQRGFKAVINTALKDKGASGAYPQLASDRAARRLQCSCSHVVSTLDCSGSSSQHAACSAGAIGEHYNPACACGSRSDGKDWGGSAASNSQCRSRAADLRDRATTRDG